MTINPSININSVIPNDSSAEKKVISIYVEAVKKINYAMQQNDVPVINRLVLKNQSYEKVENIYVKIKTSPDFAFVWETRIESISPEGTYDLGAIDLNLNHSFLAGHSERENGIITFEVFINETPVGNLQENIEILAYDEWNGLSIIPEIIAAFIIPNHPIVENILSEAADILKKRTGDSSISGYQTNNPKRVIEIIDAIYCALAERNIRYINAPASFEETGQKVRLPDRIMENKLGTCLDLSLLFAACLEQAGLFPLIIIIKGHAFTGVWIEQESFTNSVVDELLRLKKRVELNEIRLFEATLITSDKKIPFMEVINQGELHLNKESDFICAVDIIRARRTSRIRPIPIKTSFQISGEFSADGVFDGSQLPLTLDYSNLLPAKIDAALKREETETPSMRLERWKRSLLDLSLRNKLLNFKETEKSIRLLCPDLASLEDALADRERFKVFHRPVQLSEATPRNADVHQQRTGQSLGLEFVKEEFKNKRLFSDLTESALKKRILSIYREAQISREENGTNTLYIALGFLEWYESEASTQPRYAPIVLMPLDISRMSALEGFSINQSDEDTLINTTLLELLHRDFGIEILGLDPLPLDEHGIDIPFILNSFRQAVKNIPQWRVLEESFIGLFSFNKFLMWKDLESRNQELRKNRILNHLINSPDKEFGDKSSFPNPDLLDDTHKLDDTFCPLSCDSSQLAAIYAAAEGRSFVLQGPPGTGKSQTITNLIANALAHGKKVLFVAEKMAALSVVHKRLNDCGLGDFCLELHSSKSNKKEFIDQLGKTLVMSEIRSTGEWHRESSRLDKLRRELNAFVRALHLVRSTGETVYKGISEIIRLKDSRRVGISFPDFNSIDREYPEKARSIIHQLSVKGKEIKHPSVNPWVFSKCASWTPTLESDVIESINQCKNARDKLAEATRKIIPHIGIDSPQLSENEIRIVNEICSVLLDAPLTTPGMIIAADWDMINSSITSWIEHGQKRDQLRDQLLIRYTDRILEIDLEQLSDKLISAESSWFLMKWIGIWNVSQTLSKVGKPSNKIDKSKMKEDIDHAILLKNEEKILEKAGDDARKLFGRFWNEGRADWKQIGELKEWSVSLRKLAAKLAGTDLNKTARYRQIWANLISEGNEQLKEDGGIGILFKAFTQAYIDFNIKLKSMEAILSLNRETVWGASSDQKFLDTIQAKLDDWNNNISNLRSWCFWVKEKEIALKFGLESLVKAFETEGMQISEMSDVFNRSYYEWWISKIFETEPILNNFYRPEFEEKIYDFRKTDELFLKLTKDEIRARLSANIPSLGDNHGKTSEKGILINQLQRKRGLMPIRKLIETIPNLLLKLKPCLLMSPISIAQYLNPTMSQFDLVVFDEASQIPIWDAAGAIGRGTELVIVGDRKQLPPTNFFNRLNDDESEDADSFGDLESVLDDCISAQIPELSLLWHYRSLNESLIAFSNFHYYNNTLLSFPTPGRNAGVSLRYVKGEYDKSKSRTNRVEAEAIVCEILERLKNPEKCKYSIGVVTFSQSQQTLVEDLLEEARMKNPDIEAFFNKDGFEPVFVKNLENVQGDEREVILFSICYGPDSQGRVSMNFGPMNKDGGERRLNVAITRARREVIVFSSIKAHHIDLAKTKSKGVADLKCFLDYAERGYAAIKERQSFKPEADCESIFEEQVMKVITDMGYEVHPQVGCSGYRIDLAVVDPEQPGKYILGIECDGANYHRAKTARDRDQLRESILRKLGWKIYRIWSTEWWARTNGEIDKLKNTIEEAIRERNEQPEIEVQSLENILQNNSNMTLVDQTIDFSNEFKKTELPIYEEYQCERLLGNPETFYETTADYCLIQMIKEIVKLEGPISLKLLSKRLSESWQIKRTTSRTQQRVYDILKKYRFHIVLVSNSYFIWPEEVKPHNFTIFRIPGSCRDIVDIPPEEIKNAAVYIIKESVSLPVDDLIRETAKILGFQRLGVNVEEIVKQNINQLIEEEIIALKHDKITLN